MSKLPPRLTPEQRTHGVGLWALHEGDRVIVRGTRWPDGDPERAEGWERRMSPGTARRFARELLAAADAAENSCLGEGNEETTA